jgi:outer membrane receptor protein involved in Fe transport
MRFNPTLTVSSSVLALTIGLAAPAFAQDAPAAPELPTCVPGQTENCVPPEAQDQGGEPANTTTEGPTGAGGNDAIVVTGTRIIRPTLSSPVPVTTVTVDELTNTGDVSLGDALNDLPSLRSTFSQGNSTRFIGTAGLNVLDLRGLGTARTLVLVNGKRHITALPGDYLVDTNTIPVDLLERVDVVTGGNSAVYGSDAVAGVVNFVLKRDFEGISLKGQGGISSRGDRGSYFLSGTWGTNFGDGRGNIAVSAEYAKSNPLYFRDRDDLTGAFSGRCQYQAVDSDVGVPFGNDGVFDTEFLCGVANGALSDGGTVGRTGPGAFLRFQGNGDLIVQTADREFEAAGSGNIIGGGGSTLRNTGQLAAGLDRYAVNVLAHYDISDAFRPFVEAKYVHVNALQEGQPSFFQGSIPAFFGGGNELSCNNAFLTAQNRNALVVSGATPGSPGAQCAAQLPDPDGVGPLTAVFVLDGSGNRIFDPSRTFTMSRFNVDFGGRGEKHKRDTYRIVAGVEGTFNEDWNYELSVNYGKLKTQLRSLNNLVLFDLDGNPDGFLLALDAQTNGAGQIVCGINNDGNPANDRPDCVPINVFGINQATAAALDFVNTEARRRERATEFVALGSITGDSSQLFELPGGPVAFALGAEYRVEKAFSAFDDLTASGGTFLNAIQPFEPPKFTVKEAFGEINVPLLKDAFLAKELTVSGAARVSKYNTDVGTVWAYNLQGIWAPVQDLRLRAAYATSVRAPTQSDLFDPLSENFAFIADPCDSNNILVGANRAANCAAAGVPTTYNAALLTACAGTSQPGSLGAPFRNCIANSVTLGFASGGNPFLTEERGKSLTLGAVFQPRWVPGLNFTVDYYRIKVESLIAALPAQTIINLCYDDPGGINNPFCASISRDPASGLFNEPVVIAGGVNFAAQITEGIDFDIAYRRTFSNGHKISLRGIATRTLRLDNFVNPTDARRPNRQLSELGDPKWAANFSANYDIGAIDLTYNLRFLGKQATAAAFETQNEFQDICPASGITGLSGRTCIPGEIVTLDPQNLDAFPKKNYPAVFYHSARLNFEVPGSKKFNFYVGVDNIFDKKPPFGLLGTAGGDPYDTFGRFFYAGATVRM